MALVEPETEREETHWRKRFILDNLPVYLWPVFLVPAASMLWAGKAWGSAASMAVGIGVGALAVWPMLAGHARRGTSRAERATRIVVATGLCVLSAYLSYFFLLALLDDLGVLTTRMGYADLGPGSVGMFVAYLSFWTVLMSMLAERLSPWIRELLKIERLVFVILAAGLLVGRATGYLTGAGWPIGGPDLAAAGAFGFAFVIVTAMEVDRWRGRLGDDRRAATAMGGLVGLGIGVVAVVAAMGGGASGEGPGSVIPTGGVIPGPMLESFRIASAQALPWTPALALLDLAMGLGALGICVYLAATISSYFPAKYTKASRVWWCLAMVAAGWLLATWGSLDQVPMIVVVGAALLAPFAGRRTAGEIRAGGRRGAVAIAGFLAGLALAAAIGWAGRGNRPWPGDVTTSVWPLLLWLGSTLISLPLSASEQVGQGRFEAREPENEPEVKGTFG